VRSTDNATTLWRWISEGEGDLVITDVIMPDESAFELLPRIRKLRPDLPVIVMSAQNTIMTAITATEKGAYEYIPKPFDLNELTSIVARALDQPRRRMRAAETVASGERLPLIGRSPAMQEVYRVMARLMQTDLTVMVNGESGTGKELVARALHEYGKRKNGPFVALNMAAIPRELIESELFGHEKGAFTGASGRSTGKFEQAEGGTLFLDEIGDMPMEAQTRLLRVLQEGEFSRIGGAKSMRANVRIVAATHRDLRVAIQQGLFREDLYYRLNVVPLRLPPLRERMEDVIDLVRHFLDDAQNKGLPAKQFSSDALARLQQYRWPGNVRELENLVQRLAALYADDVIDLDMVESELADVAPRDASSAGRISLSEFAEHFLAEYFAGFGGDLPPPGLYNRILSQIEVPLINAALVATSGNQIKAAELLGINRNTLRKKIRYHGVSVSRGVAVERGTRTGEAPEGAVSFG
jgi:two-component system nitrogen regulation response regulator GlnG